VAGTEFVAVPDGRVLGVSGVEVAAGAGAALGEVAVIVDVAAVVSGPREPSEVEGHSCVGRCGRLLVKVDGS